MAAELDPQTRLSSLKAAVDSVTARKATLDARAAVLAEQIEVDEAALRTAGLPVDAGLDAVKEAIATRRSQLDAALADAEAKAQRGKGILDEIESAV